MEPVTFFKNIGDPAIPRIWEVATQATFASAAPASSTGGPLDTGNR